MSKKHALVASYSIPEGDRDSGARRMIDLIDFLLEVGYAVTFVAASPITDPSVAQPLLKRGVAVLDGMVTRKTEVGPEPILAEILTARPIDLALLAFWPVAELYLPIIRRVCPHAHVIVDSVDLHCLRHARRIFGDDHADTRWLDDEFASQLTGELNVYAAADGVLTVSEKEAAWIDNFCSGAVRTFCVPDCEDLQPGRRSFAERKGMLALGSYQHPPNVQGVEFLCQQILPKVVANVLNEHPLYIVGNGLDERVHDAAANTPGARLVGWVPSVTPYFEQARISVVPLRYGAGTKRKVVQALLSGTPTVTTSIGAEGLNLIHEEHVLIADEPEQFAAAIERLLSDEPLWQKLSKNGRDHLFVTHSRDAAKSRLIAALSVVEQRTPKKSTLPEVTAKTYLQRVFYGYNDRLVVQLRYLLGKTVPHNANVLVFSGGSNQFLQLAGRIAAHFPQGDDNRWLPYVPDDVNVVMCCLERLRQQGADYLVIPFPSLWWPNHFPELGEYLQHDCKLVIRKAEVGDVYALGQPTEKTLGILAHVETTTFSVANISETDANGNGDTIGHTNGHAPGSGRSSILSPVIKNPVKLIAFYLPQYHPIPENDIWWGEGFTEWTNVAKAQPLFDNHWQPHLPTDFGYYDLRSVATRLDQAVVAREFGIHGFCYYHYWFNGKQLLQRPFEEVLASGEPDFPFCLCWANEPWSRRWDGRPHDVLQEQTYSSDDDVAHIRHLLPALQDRRAIQVDGKPLFLVYQAKDLPDPARTVATWREEVERAGISGLYLIAVETGWDAGWDATQFGFDAKVLFHPQFTNLFNSESELSLGPDSLKVYDYQKAWPVLANPDPVDYLRYETVFPTWDNTARKGADGVVLQNSTPDAYQSWLSQAVERAIQRPLEERIVFLNAWNEWGEGCHLEPDRLHGRAYLEATRRAWQTAAARKVGQETR